MSGDQEKNPGSEWDEALAEQGASGGGGDPWADALQEQAQSASPRKAPAEQYQRAELADLRSEGRDGENEDMNLEMLLDIPVTISMEIGRSTLTIRNLLQLTQGSVVELNRLAGEPLDVLVNGTLIAHGEVVVVNEKFGIRLTDVISPSERVKKLR